jgi:hypothetical protein
MVSIFLILATASFTSCVLLSNNRSFYLPAAFCYVFSIFLKFHMTSLSSFTFALVVLFAFTFKWSRIASSYIIKKRNPERCTIEKYPNSQERRLQHGFCNYFLEGGGTTTSQNVMAQELVVILHGFSGSSVYEKYLKDALISRGRRVLRFDWFGRGHSSCPDVEMNAEFLVGNVFCHLEITTTFCNT